MMIRDFSRSLNNLKDSNKKIVKLLFGSNISLYISVVVWLFLTNWNMYLTDIRFPIYLLSAITAGAGSAYLVFTWLFYIYVRISNSLYDIFLSFIKILGHFIIIVLILVMVIDKMDIGQGIYERSYLIQQIFVK